MKKKKIVKIKSKEYKIQEKVKEDKIQEKVKEDKIQEQEMPFIGDYKLRDYYDWSRNWIKYEIGIFVAVILSFIIAATSNDDLLFVIWVFLFLFLTLFSFCLGWKWAIKSIFLLLNDKDFTKMTSILGLIFFFIPFVAFIGGLIIQFKIRKKYPNIDIRI